MTFQDYFSIEDFKKIYELYAGKENTTDTYARPKQSFYDESKLFFSSVVKFLQALNEEKGLLPIKYSDGHDTRFQNCWNKIINKEDIAIESLQYVGRPFFRVLINELSDKSSEIESSYKNLIEKMNKGNFYSYDVSLNDSCICCGQQMDLEIKDWNVEYYTFNMKKDDFLPPESCSENKIIELSIDFKTEDILIADWFKIDEFTNKVKYNQDYNEVSINFAKGREASTRHSVENFNYITVHVGNSCPTIFQNGNDFVFGYSTEWDEKNITLEDNKGYTDHGSVCTDLWNVTIIEKAQLINIVAESVGMEKATQIVTEYLEDYDHNSFKVEPGIYKLRFHPTYEEFHKLDDDENVPTIVEPFFTLKKEVLELNNTLVKHKFK